MTAPLARIDLRERGRGHVHRMLEMHSCHAYMFTMNWGAFDLNLLIVFDAVMQERSVTRAGSRIGLSQPAMSHALNRLRYVLKDQLFVRTPEGMVPTPRAELLAQPLRNALSEMQLALEPAVFDPAASDRRFALALNNYAAVVLAPPLVAAVSAAAPAVRLDLRPSGTLDIVDRLDRGDLDLTLGSMDSPGERFATAPLLEDPFVMVMRRGHPAGQRKLSAAAFAAVPHLEISAGEYSREFSAKVFNDQSRLIELGFRQAVRQDTAGVLRPQASQIRYTQTDEQLERGREPRGEA
jgi:DNA-binding transcriptional LysR family regulator